MRVYVTINRFPTIRNRRWESGYRHLTVGDVGATP
ncbi:hypothetical protein BJ928_105300 [Rhizobium sp. WW_1]|jgi:hypothetical protein|nr:hypothetical protein BJ928_105300 [Rhizobium sp. WW_1]